MFSDQGGRYNMISTPFIMLISHSCNRLTRSGTPPPPQTLLICRVQPALVMIDNSVCSPTKKRCPAYHYLSIRHTQHNSDIAGVRYTRHTRTAHHTVPTELHRLRAARCIKAAWSYVYTILANLAVKYDTLPPNISDTCYISTQS